jgi:hypothetical protein
MPAAFFPLLRLVSVVICLSLVTGCADPKQRAAELVRRNDVTRLRRDAALLYKDLFAGHGEKFFAVRSKSWPKSFKAFSPIRVGAYRDGISLALEASSAAESGLYIIPWQMDVVPSTNRGAQFQQLAEGVYWYSFGD